MPSPILTVDQYNLVLSGGYRGADYIIACPNTVIFAARVNGTPSTSVFAQFNYDTVTTGAYTDIAIGQAVLISHTSNIREAFSRGRVRKTPTALTLYINECSDAIVDNDYIFVVDTYDVVEKLRHGAFADWDVAFHKVPPIVKGLQSAYVKLTTASSASLSLSPVGQALTKSATISSYAWSIPGVTYTTGSAATQNIVITVPSGHRWGRLTVTDSNGVSNWFVFQIIVGDPQADTFFRLCHEPPDIAADWQTGYTASTQYWNGVDDLLDMTRIVIVSQETYNDGAPDWGSVRFVGYFADDKQNITGDETYAQLIDADITLSGFLPLAGELTFSPIAVRHDTTPTAWDEIHTPTPQRIVTHILAVHSTLFNLCACDFGTIDDTYFTGDFNVAPESLMDAVQTVLEEINGQLTQDAAGQLVLERNANFLSDADRDALDTVTPTSLTLGEGMRFSLQHGHQRKVGSVEVGFAVFNTTTNTRYFLRANAPANGAGRGQEHRSIQSQLLAANTVTLDAAPEAGDRAGHWLEWLNPTDTMSIDLDDGLGFLSPSAAQWYTFTIPASNWIRGLGIDSATRWLLTRISVRVNADGTRSNQGEFRRETRGGTANIQVSLVPSVTETELAVLPVRAVMAAFPPSSSINYDSTSPTTRQPRRPFDGWASSPLTPEQAAQAAAAQAEPGCWVQSPPVNFKNPSNVSSNFVTTLGETYTITVSGSAQIQSGAGPCLDADRFTIGTVDSIVGNEITVSSELHTGSYRIRWGDPGDPSGCCTLQAFEVVSGAIWSATAYDCDGGFVNVNVLPDDMYYYDHFSPLGAYTFKFTLGDGDGIPRFADAFYIWEEDDDGEPINVELNPLGGLYLDNAAVSVPPPFSSNHEYEITFTGTGNVILSRFNDDDYSDNASLILYMKICGPGA